MNDVVAVRYHDGEGWRCALARSGRTKMHFTMITELGIVHRAEPLTAIRYTQPLMRKGVAYPILRMIRKFRDIAKARGITEAAKEELRRAGVVVSSPPPTEAA
jgi:hypothetical protein